MYQQLSPKEKQRQIKLAKQAGFSKKWAEDVVNKMQWLKNNRARLADSHTLTMTKTGTIISFDVFCHMVWITIGRKEYHEQRQATLN